MQGFFNYEDRNCFSQPGKDIKVTLYDVDSGGSDDVLGTTTVDQNGFFQFPTRANWDDDDPDPTPENRKLDLLVKGETHRDYTATAFHQVTDFNRKPYDWQSNTLTNTPDGTADFTYTLPQSGLNIEVMWIFQDIRRAREYFLSSTNPQNDPGLVSALWQQNQNTLLPCNGSCFMATGDPPYVFIGDDSTSSSDTVVHETGHAYMYSLNGRWLWWDIGCITEHFFFLQEDPSCAWTEGWADFFALAANGDPCYDFGAGACLPNSFNFEKRNYLDDPAIYHHGDEVEGRVAGALYDLMDTNNEPYYDSTSAGFAPIANVLTQAPTEVDFWFFWVSFRDTAGENNHNAIRTIKQNAIDYNSAPVVSNRSIRVLQNVYSIHRLDLWDVSYDVESADSELTYQVTNISDQRCGVAFDSHWLNVNPQPGWLGS